MLETCALDVADSGAQTYLEVAEFTGVSKQAVEQMEGRLLKRLADVQELRECDDVD
jgi:hypothetical protein